MATTFHFSHDTSYSTFIYVRHNAATHSGYAIRHEYMRPPHNGSSIALHAWGHEEPVFIGHFGHIVEHWEDCVDISIHPSLDYYSYPTIVPQTYLLRIPMDLLQLSAMQTVIRNFHLRLFPRTHIEKFPPHTYPYFFYQTKLAGSQKRIGLIPLDIYKVVFPSTFITIEHKYG